MRIKNRIEGLEKKQQTDEPKSMVVMYEGVITHEGKKFSEHEFLAAYPEYNSSKIISVVYQ